MAFLHLYLGAGSTNSKAYFKLDGWKIFTFHNGDYVEIPDGTHLITFEGANTDWQIQENLNSHDCMTITVLATSMGMIMGAPEYKIEEHDDDVIEMIKGFADEIAQNEQERSSANFKFGLKMFISIIMLGASLACFTSSYVIWAIISLIIGGILLISTVAKRKKDNK